jgi:hypothetical protein
MSNINSFAENLAKLTENTADIISTLEGINESMSGNSAEINLSESLALPSYSNVVKRVSRVENTIAKFTQGKGTIETDDGTYRKIKVSTISRPPETITGVGTVNAFATNSNWFFESLQYPKCCVRINLKNKIDDTADRVYVDRIILDSTETIAAGTGNVLDFYNANIAGQNLNYVSLLNLLSANNIAYSEDKDTLDLPLTYERYKGEFIVDDIRLVKDSSGNSKVWYYFNTLSYSVVDENGTEQNNNNLLGINDYIRFNDSLFKIIDIEQSKNCVRLEYAIGYETIGVGDTVELYNEPFADKNVEVGIGINEIDIIYIKGVNESYNLLSREWSEPISFYTNSLVLDTDQTTTFASYYSTNVADFGRDWIAQAKEKQIRAYNGLTPYAPVLNANDLKVVQINTQLDATLDTETYNNLTTQIASTKSNITATRSTISTNKDKLIQSTNSDERVNIQNLINTDTETLNSLTTQYNSLVENLNTLLVESGAINYSPKYRIRGFFAIPSSRFTDETNQVGEQSVIGFDIMYRYLHTDETGVKLDTYEYSSYNPEDSSLLSSATQTGVFTDWNMITSATLSKTYDELTQSYKWIAQNTSDGSQININQIDIPIQNGEKVEIKVRSISEAGYPYNPLKSSWSNSVIISFPDNLTTDDSVTTILETIKSDLNAVVLQETLSAAGVYTHIADGNSSYKHTASNISYTDSVTDSSGNTSLTEMSVQNKLDSITNLLSSIQKTLTELSSNSALLEIVATMLNISKNETSGKYETPIIKDKDDNAYSNIVEYIKEH